MAKEMRADENYVIDLCDDVLKEKSSRQHRFNFLIGDSGTKLPVDAYYPKLALVVEFHERQHSAPVKLFDKRQTISGVSRGEQRKIYDQRRREVLPKHGITVVEFTVDEFPHNSRKKLLRKPKEDKAVILEKLKSFIKP